MHTCKLAVAASDLAAVYPVGDLAIHPDDCACEGCDPAGVVTTVWGDYDGDGDKTDVDALRDAIRCGDIEHADTYARW